MPGLPPPSPLDYGVSPRRLSRGARRWLIAAISVSVVLTVAAYFLYPTIHAKWLQIQLLYCQHHWMTFTAPPGQIMYEEDPSRFAALLATGEYALDQSSFMNYVEFDGRDLQRVGFGGGTGVYFHERVSPAGHHRLVVISTHCGFTSAQGDNVNYPPRVGHDERAVPLCYGVLTPLTYPPHPPATMASFTPFPALIAARAAPIRRRNRGSFTSR